MNAMDVDIVRKLKEGYVRELQKPEIDPFERAAIIASVLDENKWSVREMARQWGFPKSTLEDWLLFNRLSEQEYYALRKKGFSATHIYRELRENRISKAGKVKAKVGGAKNFEVAELNLALRQVAVVVKRAVTKAEYDDSTLDVIKELRNELNRLESAIERKSRR